MDNLITNKGASCAPGISRVLSLCLCLLFLCAFAGQTAKAQTFSGGTGTSGDPYKIASEADLKLIAGAAFAGTYFKLMDDITLISPWTTPIGSSTTAFAGIFDGNKKIVKGLSITGSTQYRGLFGNIAAAGKITDLGVEGSVSGGSFTGGLAGKNAGTIEKCHFTGTVTGIGESLGGLIGVNLGSVSECYANAGVTSTSQYVGGLVGSLMGNSKLENCYATGAVEGTNAVGGIAGYDANGSTIENCVALNPSVKGRNSGRILGLPNATAFEGINKAWEEMVIFSVPAEQNFFAAASQRPLTIYTSASDFTPSITSQTPSTGWCTIQKKAGQDYGNLVIAVTENTTGATRTAQIKVTSPGFADETITVTQGGYGWKVTWQDEFDTDGFIDPTKWGTMGAINSSGLKYLSRDPRLFKVQNGVLTLIGRLNDASFSGGGLAEDASKKWVSGGLQSYGRKNFRSHGKVVIRAQMDKIKGTWPALWFNGYVPNKWCEIDLIEYYDTRTYVNHQVHTDYTKSYGLFPPNTPPSNAGSTTNVSNVTNWHDYGLEICDDKLVFSVDGVDKWTYKRATPAVTGQWPFDTDMFLMMDMQINDSSSTPASNFYGEMRIDWVRYYEWK